MTIEIKASSRLGPLEHQLLETRMNQLASRLGPFTRVQIEVDKGFVGGCTIRGAIQIPPTWIVRPSGVADRFEAAVDRFHAEALTLIRHVVWARDGVPDPCRWCGGDEFVFVREPADATDTGSTVATSSAERKRLVRASNGRWYGDLETLVCRTCGHVEWFASDPLSIPIDAAEGIVLVKVRPPASPYRGEPG